MADAPALEAPRKKIKLLVAACGYQGVNLSWFADGITLTNAAAAQSIPGVESVRWWPIGGDGLIGRARNNQAAYQILETDCDKLLFPDCDISYSPAHVARLVWHDKPIVGGLYAIKDASGMDGYQAVMNAAKKAVAEENPQAMAALRAAIASAKDTRWVKTDLPNEMPDAVGLQKVAEIGTGFLMIDRKVFEHMVNAFPEIMYFCDGSANRPARWNFFMNQVVDHRLLSEDYGFCHLARKIGYDIWADTLCQVEHEGMIRYPLSGVVQPKFPPDAP